MSAIYDTSESLVQETDKLTDSGGYAQATWNQMCLQIRDDLLSCVLIGVLLAGGDLTGLPMNRLVSYEEQNAAALKTEQALRWRGELVCAGAGPLGQPW